MPCVEGGFVGVRGGCGEGHRQATKKKDKLGSVPRGAPSACVLVCLCVCLASCSGLDMKEEDVWCFMRRVFAYVEVGQSFTRIG